MCSTSSAGLDDVCRAIDELADRWGIRRGATGAADDDIAARLAETWAMIADANPEVARRVPGYLSAAE